MPQSTTAIETPGRQLYRIEVRLKADQVDPTAAGLLDQARRHCGSVNSLRTARVFLLEAPLEEATVRRIASELLCDPVTQEAVLGSSPHAVGQVVEVHYKPGVMDPVAQSTRDAVVDLVGDLPAESIEVRTGLRIDLSGAEGAEQALERFAAAALANPVIQHIHLRPCFPDSFPHGERCDCELTHFAIRDLDDDALQKLSRRGHLFLSLAEMQAVRDFFRVAGREPTDIELETLAQTWSEHCVHKTLKATIRYEQGSEASPGAADWLDRPGHRRGDDGALVIDNLLRSTIAAATRKLMADGADEFCISVFEDNAGILRFDETDGVCIKVETHNHPSAIEPYGGAATGVGGCIRDVLGTGLAARPIANTDVFCVAPPDHDQVPKGVIAPRRILEKVVAGVRDYGNRMGIPTVNGAVWFHRDYVANPLVFCGCVGVLPLDKCFGDAAAEDHIVVLGGHTGRDGIHGATFSSAELTDGHADEFGHAVQIGNAITQKKMLDVILQARDHPDGCLFRAITDCGAGGFSSAVGEMGEKVGAEVGLEQAPLKYEGLSYTEIWISEAQERMVLAVPPQNMKDLQQLCEDEDVSCSCLGRFGAVDAAGDPQLVLGYDGHEVGRLPMKLLHDGLPTPTRRAFWSGVRTAASGAAGRPDVSPPTAGDALRALLGSPNIASKHWIVRQYDHEVQGGSVLKPLVGPGQDGPGDAAVVRPKLDSRAGVALGCGLQPGMSEKDGGDSYWAALAAIDEAVRNVVCAGADPQRIALLDNFCWPGCDDPENLGSLVRAAEACYDGALAYKAPFVSGKDSLNNQFTTEDGRLITIPPTLLITALGIVADTTRCRTMNAKAAGDALLIVGRTGAAMGGSHYASVAGDRTADALIPRTDLETGPAHARAVAALLADELAEAVHDLSDGGLLVAAAEMAFAGRVGLHLEVGAVPTEISADMTARCFAETPSRYLVEVSGPNLKRATQMLEAAGVAWAKIGELADHQRFVVPDAQIDEPLDELRQVWRAPLDW